MNNKNVNVNIKMLMSVPQAAKAFGLGRDKMRELVRTDPTIPTLQVGGHTKINTKLFMEWLNEKTEKKEAI